MLINFYYCVTTLLHYYITALLKIIVTIETEKSPEAYESFVPNRRDSPQVI